MFMYVQNKIKRNKVDMFDNQFVLYQHIHILTIRFIHVQQNIKEIIKNKKHLNKML